MADVRDVQIAEQDKEIARLRSTLRRAERRNNQVTTELKPLHDLFRRNKMPGDNYRAVAERTLRVMGLEEGWVRILAPLVEVEVTRVYQEHGEPHPRRAPDKTTPLIGR